MEKVSPFQVWILATRPKTLTAAFAPLVVAGALIFAHGDEIIWWILLCALVAAVAIQIGTNLFNDVIDFQKGTDTHERLGPTRVTQTGFFSPRKVFWGACCSFFIAFLVSIPLVLKGGIPILVIGLLSFLFGYLYTAGPYPLSYQGAGEIFVILFFGLIAVGGIVYLHDVVIGKEMILAGLQMGLLSTVMLAINNLRDVEGDKKARKRSFAVRFGIAAARKEIAFLCFVPFVLNLFWVLWGNIPAALLPLLALPLAIIVTKGVFSIEPSRTYNQFLAKGALLHLLFGLLLSLGLVYGH